jgi:hypothetical protein
MAQWHSAGRRRGELHGRHVALINGTLRLLEAAKTTLLSR